MDQDWHFYDVFSMEFSLCGRIPSFLENSYHNVNWLWEDFCCQLIFSGRMWEEFFSHCDSHCEKNVNGDEDPFAKNTEFQLNVEYS